MTDFLEKNLLVLTKRNPSLVDKLRAVLPERGVTILESREGAPVPVMEREGRPYTLHSRFKPIQEGLKSSQTFTEKGVKVFLGLGGAYQISPFLNRGKILIVEPVLAELKALLSLIDYRKVLESPLVSLMGQPQEGEIERWVKENYLPLLDGGFNLIPLRSYKRDKAFKSYTEEVQNSLDQVASDCSTQKKMGRIWQRNILFQAERALGRQDALHFTGKRAILAAAGPGLSLCRKEIIERSSQEILLSVDTALPTLLEWGIKPDYVVSLDPQFIGYLHYMDKLPNESIIIADWGSHEIRNQINPVHWVSSAHPLCSYLAQQQGATLTESVPGGNVTQAALSLLIEGGVSQITLLGADFSYPQGKPYVEGSYFFKWFERIEARLVPRETSLTGFVLSQKQLEKRGQSPKVNYLTPRLDMYKNELNHFLYNKDVTVDYQQEHRWELSVEKGASFSEKILPGDLGKDHERSILNTLKEYQGVLKKQRGNWEENPSVLATLIPLAYHFLKNSDGQRALSEAKEYTLALLEVIIEALHKESPWHISE